MSTQWLSTRLAPASVAHGTVVTLSGLLTVRANAAPLPATTVLVQYAPATVWGTVGSLVTNANGLASISFPATRSGLYRFRYPGSTTYAGSVSPAFALTVVGQLTAAISPTALQLGRPAVIRGSSRPGGVLYLQRHTSVGWRNLQTKTVSSTYQFAVRPAASGVYAFRVLRPATGGIPTLVSRVLRLSVYRASLIAVRADPPGEDRRNLNGEFATVRNTGAVAIKLLGWQLDAGDLGERYPIPAATLFPGRSVRIHTGRGLNTATDLYLRLNRPIWDNLGDTGTLIDANRHAVSRFTYR